MVVFKDHPQVASSCRGKETVFIRHRYHSDSSKEWFCTEVEHFEMPEKIILARPAILEKKDRQRRSEHQGGIVAKTKEDVELVEETRKAVRRYAEGIRRAKDMGSQLVYEDALVEWIFVQVRKTRM